MSNLSVRGLPDEALALLKAKAVREGASVNALVLRLINQGIGRNPEKAGIRRHHDLDALQGCWSAEEAAEFEAATQAMREIDAGQWR